MKHFKHHHKPSDHAVHLGALDANEAMTGTIVLRRKPDHAPIPSFDSYIGCPPRQRLPEDVFASMYGASDQDVDDLKAHYQQFGFHAVEEHKARRQIYLTGKVHHFNDAFRVSMQRYKKDHKGHDHHFRGHPTIPMIPDHFEEKIVDIKLDNEIRGQRAATGTIPAVTSHLTPSQMMTMYGVPTNSATDQNIAIVGQGGSFLNSDLSDSCTVWGITTPTIKSVIIDSISAPGENNETLIDFSMCAAFGGGATLVLYQASSHSEIYPRVLHPSPGDPVCNIISTSYIYAPETDAVFNANILEDCAIQGITIFAASGDWGTTAGGGTSSDQPIQCGSPAASPYVTGVGGTTIGALTGTVSPSNFVEWAWNDANAYFNVSGGGVSNQFVKPSYQNGITMPATLSTTTNAIGSSQGRGVPDIAANADVHSGLLLTSGGVRGGLQSNGTSQAAPIMAGIFARVNSSLGRAVGFINPTLYAGESSFMRKVNAGGPTDNTMVKPSGGFYSGYQVSTTSWNPVVGLGIVNGTNFVTYLTSNSETSGSFPGVYYVQIESVNNVGSTFTTVGPFHVKAS